MIQRYASGALTNIATHGLHVTQLSEEALAAVRLRIETKESEERTRRYAVETLTLAVRAIPPAARQRRAQSAKRRLASTCRDCVHAACTPRAHRLHARRLHAHRLHAHRLHAHRRLASALGARGPRGLTRSHSGSSSQSSGSYFSACSRASGSGSAASRDSDMRSLPCLSPSGPGPPQQV